MPQVTATPILAAPPPAATPGAAALAAAAATPGGVAGSRDAGAQGVAKSGAHQDGGGTAVPAEGGDSFAAVLGRQLAKAIDDPSALPLAAVASRSLTPTATAAADKDDKGAAEKSEPPASGDGIAAGIASLLPLLQSLLPAATGPRPEARAETRIDGQSNDRAGAKSGGPQRFAPLQAAPTQALALQDQAGADAPGAALARSLGADRCGQAQALPIAAANSSVGKGAAAIPAAAPLAADAPGSSTPAAPDASFANLLASAPAPEHIHRSGTPLAVAAPVGSAHWESGVGAKVVWMVGHQEQRAELILNPPELGRVEVSISVNGDQANAQFGSANPAVRDALEAALPRLREMLADAGINLGQAQVGGGAAQNAHGNSANNRENGDNSRRTSGAAESALRQGETVGVWARVGRGMVDVFA